MAESKIEWTDYTFNPWIGCSKVSSGCANCYAERDFDIRRGRAKWGPQGTRSKTSEANWKLPLRWNREPHLYDHRPRVFCASLADVFEDWDDVIVDHKDKHIGICRNCNHRELSRAHCSRCGTEQDDLTMADLRRDLFELIDATPHLDWLLVTKRPQNIWRMWPTVTINSNQQAADRSERGECYRRNVWLLTSVENQQTADARVPELLKCRELAPVLGLSCEPLLGAVDLRAVPRPDNAYFQHTGRGGVVSDPAEPDDYVFWTSKAIDWVIAGGESGPGARPLHPDWARGLRDQCQAAGVPFFFKQWGEWLPSTLRPDGKLETRTAAGTPNGPRRPDLHNWPDLDAPSLKVGKQAAGRLLDGSEHSAYPSPAS